MAKTKKYIDSLMKDLKDPKEAAEYLNAALADHDKEVFLLALKDVAEANGGITSLSKKTHLNRQNLYRMLSEAGNPELESLEKLLDAIGLKILIETKNKKAS